ncbi:MAG: hypothetical protein CJBNEKGG_03728 [Prosthecobacter sp.]|nr:hypothetical protein [Prosthecobacter sp.]
MKTFLLLGLLPLLSSQAVTVSFRHDVSGRLISVNYDGTSRSDYAYDKNGSLLSRASTVTPPLAPPPLLAGNYAGIITNTDIHAGHTGIISIKLTAGGTFSGKLTIQGVTHGFGGSFLADGSLDGLHVFIDRKDPLLDYQLTLSLDVHGSVPSISGTLTGDVGGVVFNSGIALQRDLYNSGGLTIGGGLVGRYTLVLLKTSSDPGIPQGTGYATLVVSSKGALTLAGKLANNVAITQGAQIVGMNTWPLYVPLHSSQGFIAGSLRFFPVTAPGLAVSGTLDWLKPDTTGPLHDAAFTTQLDAQGALYIPPAAGRRAMDLNGTSPNAVFTATGGNLTAPPFIRDITIDSTNKITAPLDPVSLKLSLSAPSGFVSGTFKPEAGVTRTVGGVILQSARSAAGFFPGTSESGQFTLTPPP